MSSTPNQKTKVGWIERKKIFFFSVYKKQSLLPSKGTTEHSPKKWDQEGNRGHHPIICQDTHPTNTNRKRKNTSFWSRDQQTLQSSTHAPNPVTLNLTRCLLDHKPHIPPDSVVVVDFNTPLSQCTDHLTKDMQRNARIKRHYLWNRPNRYVQNIPPKYYKIPLLILLILLSSP